MKHGAEGNKEKLPEATKRNLSRKQRTRETEDGRRVQRRFSQRIIRVQGLTVGATATVGVATVGATAKVGATATVGVATVGAADNINATANITPGRLNLGRGNHTGRGRGRGREDRYTLSVADELDTDTIRKGYCAIYG